VRERRRRRRISGRMLLRKKHPPENPLWNILILHRANNVPVEE